MKISGKYHTVDWKKFREECKESAPKGYKFKKNEFKNIYKAVVGRYKAKRKELADSH